MLINVLKRRYALFFVNHIYCGTRFFKRKIALLRAVGYDLGEGTKIVGPFYCSAKLKTGENCWIGRNFSVEGNGEVVLGSNVNIAPGVTMLTGTHEIGRSEERSGKGYNTTINVGNGVWICANSTVVGGHTIGNGSIIAACACVCSDVENNTLAGGVPAKFIKKLD